MFLLMKGMSYNLLGQKTELCGGVAPGLNAHMIQNKLHVISIR